MINLIKTKKQKQKTKMIQKMIHKNMVSNFGFHNTLLVPYNLFKLTYLNNFNMNINISNFHSSSYLLSEKDKCKTKEKEKEELEELEKRIKELNTDSDLN